MSSAFSITWMILVLVLAFVLLLSDLVFADHVLVFSLALLLAGQIINPSEALAGFANEGLITVLALFVVAAGISRTGGLDWYMSKLLGAPRTLAMAQARLMFPIAVVSAFMNNTPVVAVMIPIVQRWSKTVNRPVQQLLMPLSFSSILGGTCTLIGTSTNLVVQGLLQTRYAGTPNPPTIGLFDLSIYGVPVLFVGLAYIITFAPLLLPGHSPSSPSSSSSSSSPPSPPSSLPSSSPPSAISDLLFAATITKWSPSCNKSVEASGLRGLPGMYLASVRSKETGLVHRAVGPDMVLHSGDRLEFTGIAESFGQICSDHALEPVTHENDGAGDLLPFITEENEDEDERESGGSSPSSDSLASFMPSSSSSSSASSSSSSSSSSSTANIGASKSTFMASDRESRIKAIAQLRDLIRSSGMAADAPPASNAANTSNPSSSPASGSSSPLLLQAAASTTAASTTAAAADGSTSPRLPPSSRNRSRSISGAHFSSEMLNTLAPPSVIVAPDPTTAKKNVVLVGVNAPDRPGLVHDISKGLSRLSCNAMHTEASVVGLRSVSVWRCEVGGGLRAARRKKYGVDEGDVEEIFSVLQALLHTESGAQAMMKKGLRVIRTRVRPSSSLLGKTAEEARFRLVYRAAIVAVHRNGKAPSGRLNNIKFEAGDLLLLQVGDDSVLLTQEFNDRQSAVGLDGLPTGSTDGRTTPTRRLSNALGSILSRSPRNSSNNLKSLGDALAASAAATSASSASSSSIASTDGRTTPTRRLSNALGSILSRSPRNSSNNLKSLEDSLAASAAATSASSSSIASPAHSSASTTINLPDISISTNSTMTTDLLTPSRAPLRSALASDDNLMESQNPSDSLDALVQDIVVETPLVFDANADHFDHGVEFQGKEFLTAMTVKKNSKLSGKTLAESGIRKLPGVHLFSIERPIVQEEEEEEESSPNSDTEDLSDTSSVSSSFSRSSSVTSSSSPDVPPQPRVITISDDDKLVDGDIIWFCGSGEAIMELRKIPGLSQKENEEVKKLGAHNKRRLVQGVVARKGPLVGKSIKELKFRTRFCCVVIAVHREGTRVSKQTGSIVLHAGDVLLMEASPTFLKNNADNARCFALLSEIKDSAPPRLKLLVPALLLAASMLAVYTAGVAPLLTTALLASAGMVMLGILTQQEARDAVDWTIFVTIAAAFGVGTGMVNSGVAGGIANGLTGFANILGIGDAGLFAMVYLATVLISNVVTNNAAAALVFPIAMDAAETAGIDVVVMSYCVMLAASASFSSPFGYTTNLMIYGPGGYKFMDFVKFGGPMQVVLWLWTVVLLSVGTNHFVWWGVGFGVFVVALAGRWKWERRGMRKQEGGEGGGGGGGGGVGDGGVGVGGGGGGGGGEGGGGGGGDGEGGEGKGNAT